jgi:hypothetical protein
MGFFTGQLPRWATGASAAVTPEPSEGKKDAGWAAVERPPHQYFNWWMRRAYERLLEVDGILARALTWTAKHTFGAGAATPIAPSTGDDVVNKTYADGLIPALKAAANVWAQQQKMSGGGDALQLKAGPAGTDAVFLSFFPRGATPNVRGAWMGYGADGSAELWVLNEIGQAMFGNSVDADVKILRNGAAVISFYANGTTDAHGRRIINLADPSLPSDAATANYAQALIASLKAAANTWTAKQTFNLGISVADGHLDLDLAGAQTIGKRGGLLRVGTWDDQEVQFIRGGVIGMALHAGAEPYFASHKLTGVADPTNPGDAATKGYVDGSGTNVGAANSLVRRDANGRAQFVSPAVADDAATKGYVDGGAAGVSYSGAGVLTPSATWGSGNVSRARRSGRVVHLTMDLTATGSVANGAGTTFGTLVAALRPAMDAELIVHVAGFGAVSQYVGSISASTGVVELVIGPAISAGARWVGEATYVLP